MQISFVEKYLVPTNFFHYIEFSILILILSLIDDDGFYLWNF